MHITRKRIRPKQKVTIELEEWEAKDLEKILTRIKNQPKVSKSDFSMREKSTGRRLLDQLAVTRQGFEDPIARYEFHRDDPVIQRVTPVRQYAPRDPNSFVVFETRQEVAQVFEHLKLIHGQYGFVTLADFFELCGIQSQVTDTRVGWTDLSEAVIKRALRGFIIEFPQPQLI